MPFFNKKHKNPKEKDTNETNWKINEINTVFSILNKVHNPKKKREMIVAHVDISRKLDGVFSFVKESNSFHQITLLKFTA